MSAVMLPEDEIRRWLGPRVSLAAVNASQQCVVSGETEAVADLERRLLGEGVACHRLGTSHAFHSAMMDPVLGPFEEELRKMRLRAPRIPYLSNLTGTWIRREEATDPLYWARHLRETVRFSSGLALLLGRATAVVEIGPGQALAGLARVQAGRGTAPLIVSSSRHPDDRGSDEEALLAAVGRLWAGGLDPVWTGLHRGERRRCVRLPTYPFQRQRYWVEAAPTTRADRDGLARNPDVTEWFYVPTWKQALPPAAEGAAGARPARVLLFADGRGLATALQGRLVEQGHVVTIVEAGEGYGREGEYEYRIDPRRDEDYRRVLDDLRARGNMPESVVHLWSLIPVAPAGMANPETLDLGFYSVVSLARSLDAVAPGMGVRLTVVTTGAQDVTGEETLMPEQALVLGACRVIPLDLPGLRCRVIDVDRPATGSWPGRLVEALIGETTRDTRDLSVAYRRGRRWVQCWEKAALPAAVSRPARLRENGVYLITGGLGGVGLELARSLAELAKARLVLVSRTALPASTEWKRLAERADGELETLRFRQLQGLLEAGAEVVTVQADVADEGQMRAVIGRTLDQFGIVHGVIHAAGPDKRGLSLPEVDRDHCERQFRCRLQGLRVLEKTLRGLPLDFCIVQSSLGSILGVVGFAAYSAAHAFMDAFAAQQCRLDGVPWLAVNWDNWETWALGSRPAGADHLMSASEGREAFARLLAFEGAAQIAVSTSDLPARMDRWLGSSFLPEAETVPAPSARHPRPQIGTAYVAPRTPLEEALASIWASLLGVDRVGVDDDFFELGGDSVVSIQMVARAAQAGLRLTAKQVFEHPTIARLCTVAGSKAKGAPSAPITGPVPLTPIQSWFFEQDHPRRDHFNHAMLFEVHRRLDPEALEQGARALVSHHDALRLRFRPGSSGWDQWCEAPKDEAVSTHFDLRDLSTAEAVREVERVAADLQKSLDLEHGPTFRLAYFDLGSERGGRLLLLAHHLVVDAVSWRVLLDDLRLAYEQAATRTTPSLPAKTTSYKEWAERLRALAQAPTVAVDLEHWRSRPWREAVVLPLDHVAGQNVSGSVRRVVTAFGAEATRVLLQEVPRRHDVQVQEVLAYALARTLGAWAGTRAPLFHIEGHGREAGVEGIDLSRTVGWFTALVPVIFDLEPTSSPLAGLQAVKDQLRALPRQGVGFGVLRYLSEDGSIREELGALPRPQVSFLYHGKVDHVGPEGGWLAPASESAGAVDDPQAPRGHVLDVTAAVVGEELKVVWYYSENLHQEATIATLAAGLFDALRGLLQAQAPPTPAYAPSDFPAARLDRRNLDTLVSALKRSPGGR
jgi:non-ribosomal peptide synthase protein (TIGR01720 family)